MSLGFRVGVPGMRVRVSTRGVRASVGPRVARVHVGAGRTRVSTGLGPLFASSTLAGPRTRRPGSTPNQLAAQQRLAERAQVELDRDRAIGELEQTLDALVTVHRDSWPAATRPVLVPPALPEPARVQEKVRAWELRDVGVFARQQRREARARADANAAAYLREEHARLAGVCAQLQGDADRWWEQLRGNDEDVVCEALNAAFSDNPAGGVALGVQDGVCSVLIRQPDLDDLPTQRGGTTPTGKPTLRTLNQRDRHRLFLQSMVSNVAATLLEGFACAPGLSSITVCVLTRVQKTQRLGVVLVGRWTRTAVRATPWGTDQDAFGLVLDRAAELHLDLTVAGAARALSPAEVPVVAQVLALAECDDGAPEPDETPAAPSPLLVRSFLDWYAARESAPVAATGRRVLAPGEVITLGEAELVLPVVVTARCAAGTELDLSVLLLGDDGRVRTDLDLIFYNAPTSRTGAVRVDLPEDDGRTRCARAVVDVPRLPEEGVTRVAVVLSAGQRPISEVRGLDLAVHVSGAAPVQAPVPQEAGLPAAVVCELYRRDTSDGPRWRVRGVAQGWSDGLAGLARSYGVSVD